MVFFNLGTRRAVFIAMCLSGATALVYEVVGSKALFFFFAETSYSVATVLSTFMLGLALGSLAIAKTLHRVKNRERLFAVMQFGIGAYALLVLTRYAFIPSWLEGLYFMAGTSGLALLAVKFLVGSAYLLLPSILLGACFPLASSLLVKKANKAGRDVGLLYSVDTFGAIFGALAAGFLLLPSLGLTATCVVAAAMNFVSALVIFPRGRVYILVGAVLIFMLSSPLQPPATVVVVQPQRVLVNQSLSNQSLSNQSLSNQTFNGTMSNTSHEIPPPDLAKIGNNSESLFSGINSSQIIFSEESPYGQVLIADFGRDNYSMLALFIDKRAQCYSISLSEKQIANLTLDQLEENASVLNIGLGCGCTLSAILAHENTSSVDVVEINPIIVRAQKFFANETDHPLNDSRTSIILDDAAHYLRVSDKKYDAIVMDIENPAVLHSSPLYTVEYFREMNDTLEPGGIFGLWAYTQAYKPILYCSLRRAFAFVYPTTNRGALLFVSSNHELDEGLLEMTAAEAMTRNELEASVENCTTNTLDKNAFASFPI